MAHFVKLDENNIIIDGVVVNNAALDPENEEASGIAFLNNLYGIEENWKQTSYNNNIRKQYAGIGYTYDPVADVFIEPQPYPSWSLDENYDWQPPTPMPTEGRWYWDEATLSWVEVELPAE
jgi:hypothetical protein